MSASARKVGEVGRYPQPVVDEEGRIGALRWPCGHESDPGEDCCPRCAEAASRRWVS